MFRQVAGNIAEGEFRFKEGEEARALYEESRESSSRSCSREGSCPTLRP